jgi:hypothetical protein
MHDFDAARIEAWRERHAQDRTFRIGGEEFTYLVAVPPEALLPWLSMNEEMGEAEALANVDLTVLNFLEPGQEEKWNRVRADRPAEGPPITQADLLALCKWLMGQQTGRPTGTSSGSSTGSPTRESGTTSKDGSSSPVLAAV